MSYPFPPRHILQESYRCGHTTLSRSQHNDFAQNITASTRLNHSWEAASAFRRVRLVQQKFCTKHHNEGDSYIARKGLRQHPQLQPEKRKINSLSRNLGAAGVYCVWSRCVSRLSTSSGDHLPCFLLCIVHNKLSLRSLWKKQLHWGAQFFLEWQLFICDGAVAARGRELIKDWPSNAISDNAPNSSQTIAQM